MMSARGTMMSSTREPPKRRSRQQHLALFGGECRRRVGLGVTLEVGLEHFAQARRAQAYAAEQGMSRPCVLVGHRSPPPASRPVFE